MCSNAVERSIFEIMKGLYPREFAERLTAATSAPDCTKELADDVHALLKGKFHTLKVPVCEGADGRDQCREGSGPFLSATHRPRQRDR